MDLSSSLQEISYADTFIKMCEIYLDSYKVSDEQVDDMLDFMSKFTSIESIGIAYERLSEEHKNYKENKIY